MGSVNEEITRIADAKTDIKNAIEDCGVDVDDTYKIDTYDDYIRAIPAAVFSQFNVSQIGDNDTYIKYISQVNGKIEATTGGLASSSSSGLMSSAHYDKLKGIADGAQPGTVTSITPGTGLTGTSNDAAITTSGTINLKPATTTEIGGIMIANVRNSSPSLTTNKDAEGRYYGVELNSANKAFVNVPWTDTTQFTITADASDDDVVILSGTNGTNKVTYSASHAQQGPTSGFNGVATTTSQSPSHSGTATLNIPKLTVNKYGHVTDIANQAVKITMPSHTNHTISKGTETNCTISVTNSGSTSTIGVAVPAAAANTLGVVKGWHRTSGTAAGTQTTNATNSPSINTRSTTNDRYYGVETDSKGAMFVNVPWSDNNTKLTAVNYTAATQTDSTSDTISVVTEVGNATGITGSSVTGTYKTQNVYTKTYVDAVKTRVSTLETRLSTAMRYIGKTSSTISDGSSTNPITIGSNTVTAVQGDVVIDNNNKKEYIWNSSNWEEFGNEGNYKVKQAKVESPTADKFDISFIDTISQDEEGLITVTKRTVQSASESQSGVVNRIDQTFKGNKTFTDSIYIKT